MNALTRSVVLGAATVAGYLAVVVATTPALAADAAIRAAVEMNYPVMAGMGTGVGLQSYLACRARQAGTCSAGSGRGTSGANTAGATATSFFSFFSLVPLGCCGWWLYVLSLLPSVAGAGVTVVLIEHSQSLAYAGVAAIFGLCGLSAYRLWRRSPNARRRLAGPRSG